MRTRTLVPASTALLWLALAANAIAGGNTAPVLNAAASPALYAVPEDAPVPSGTVGTPLTFIIDLASEAGGLDNVVDPDGGAVTGLAVTAAQSSDGTWWYSIDDGTSWTALGSVSNASARLLAADSSTRLYFRGNANYFGNATLTFRAWDRTSGTNGGVANTVLNGGTTAFSTATDTAPILVYNINDPPTLTGPASINVTEDLMVPVIGAGGGDVDGDELTVGVQVSNGTVSLGTVAGLSFYFGTGSNDAAVIFGGAQASINAALATLTYRPTADYYGADSLQLSVTDLFVNVPPMTIPITVAPVVDVAVHNINTDEDQPVSINPLTADSFEGPAAIQSATPTNGSVSMVGNTLTFTPSADFNGTGSFTYDVSSGGAVETGLVTVTVLPVNDPPTLDPIAAQPSLAVNAGQQIVALGGISAGPGEAQALTVAAISDNTALIPHPIVEYTSPGNTGLLRYTPQGGQGGVAVITVTVTDNGGGNDHITRTFQVQVDTFFKNGFD